MVQADRLLETEILRFQPFEAERVIERQAPWVDIAEIIILRHAH